VGIDDEMRLWTVSPPAERARWEEAWSPTVLMMTVAMQTRLNVIDPRALAATWLLVQQLAHAAVHLDTRQTRTLDLVFCIQI